MASKTTKKPMIKSKDFILYILNRLEPQKSDKIRLNKTAFFAEFAFYYFYSKELSDARYAAINKGPVIDNYDQILKEMENEGSIKIDGYVLRPLKSPIIDADRDIMNFVDSIIEKYSCLNNDELIALSHSTDSYKITTENEKKMGDIIDKKLSKLETFFEDSNFPDVDEKELPRFNKAELIDYAN